MIDILLVLVLIFGTSTIVLLERDRRAKKKCDHDEILVNSTYWTKQVRWITSLCIVCGEPMEINAGRSVVDNNNIVDVMAAKGWIFIDNNRFVRRPKFEEQP